MKYIAIENLPRSLNVAFEVGNKHLDLIGSDQVFVAPSTIGWLPLKVDVSFEFVLSFEPNIDGVLGAANKRSLLNGIVVGGGIDGCCVELLLVVIIDFRSHVIDRDHKDQTNEKT